MLQVLGRPTSINVRKVLWTCAELGLRFEHVPWGDSDLSLRSPQYLALNPNALVPVIDDGGFVLWESNTVCRYLAAKAGDSTLLPAAAQARARIEQWMDWQATELNTAWRPAFMGLVRRRAEYQDAVVVAAGVTGWNRHMQILDAALAASGPYITGEHFTLADIVLGLSVHRWMSTPMARPALPAVAAYRQRLAAREGWRLYCTDRLP